MKELLWLVVAFPFAGSLILMLIGKRLSRMACAFVGVGSILLAAVFTFIVGVGFLHNNPSSVPFNQSLWQWINVYGLTPNIAFHLDTVSLTFVFVITFVGALIHFYSAQFMWKDEGFTRFFVFMNLFVGLMLLLVLTDNLLVLYFGWEGVTLCSFLLIGFWYKDSANGYAAQKAFIVTRVGDTSMLIGLFILFMTFHTLNIQDILTAAPSTWLVSSGPAVLTAFLLLGGAIGKSAQLPLQTWLPDAMLAPSPVSALLHAATMVTAGVYLIARTHVLFELAPLVQSVMAMIGAATLLVAGLSALNQHDIKKVLAYSTISQIGYMFLALGVGAWSAAIFHFMTHAFFKALLFLGAGAIITVLGEEHNMFKMGGLRKKLPIVFWTYLIASSSLAALPFVTAGFYSKDKIIWMSYASDKGSLWLWLAALLGALLTALYTFRMVFLTFFGNSKTEPTHRPGAFITMPLVVLAVLSFAAGFIELPATMGHFTLLSDFIEKTLPAANTLHFSYATELLFQLISIATVIIGIFVAYKYYYNKPFPAAEPERNKLQAFLYNGWDFDLLYDFLFVKPLVFLSRIDKNDFIDLFYKGIESLMGALHKVLSATQNGKVRRYAMSIAIGTIITLTILLFL
ncbi:MAG: NADH-quinone oxidoreductase subunit L [Bacteroidia bacterium]